MIIAAIILAAGRSTRMGANKLIEIVGDRPLIRHVADAALASQAQPVLVVTGHQRDDIAAKLNGLPLTLIHNPHYADGLSTSLKAGIAALPSDVDAALILLGDMPLIEPVLIDQMIERFQSSPRAWAVVPVHDGEWGNPVLISRAVFDEINRLEGDAGARKVLLAHRDAVIELAVPSHSILLDLDTPEALAKLRGGPDGIS